MMESEPDRGATDASLRIHVNGVALERSLPCSVTELLAGLGLAGKRVAVSVNRSVVPRTRHAEALVRAGDRIEILEAVGGG